MFSNLKQRNPNDGRCGSCIGCFPACLSWGCRHAEEGPSRMSVVRVIDKASGRVEVRAGPATIRDMIRGTADQAELRSWTLATQQNLQALEQQQHDRSGRHHTPAADQSVRRGDRATQRSSADWRRSLDHHVKTAGIAQGGGSGAQTPTTPISRLISFKSARRNSVNVLDNAITGLDAGAGGAEDVLVVDQREVLKGAVWSAYEQGQFAGLNEDGMSTQDVQVEEHDSKATGPGGWLRASWSTLSDGLAAWQDRLRVFGQAVWEHPRLLLVPLFVLLLCLALGLFGVLRAAAETRSENRAKAHRLAEAKAYDLHASLAAAAVPCRAAASLVQIHWRNPVLVNRAFAQQAPYFFGLAQDRSVYALSFAPQAVIGAMYDPRNVTDGVKLDGVNLLTSPVYRDWVLSAIASADGDNDQESDNADLTVDLAYSVHRQMGPSVPVRMPVFIGGVAENETFGLNYSADPYCKGQCYRPQYRSKFWGMIIAWVHWATLLSSTRLDVDVAPSYNYRLTAAAVSSLNISAAGSAPSSITNDNPTATSVLAESVPFQFDGECVAVDFATPPWVLCLEPHHGWGPRWQAPLIALVVIMSVALACLVLGILVTRHLHFVLLSSMMPEKVILQLQRGRTFTESFGCVTILFSDIVSYTTMASEMSPGAIVRMLNELYSLYDTLCEKYGLYKVETIGDAFMAVGGCPTAEDPVASAARVARMAEAMVSYTRLLVTEEGHSVRIRVGIHSGPVTAAVVGLKMPRYALFGDTVNTASRMESNSAPMAIHVSSRTAQLLRQSGQGFMLRERGGVQVKGKGLMETYWLLPQAPEELQNYDWGMDWSPWEWGEGGKEGPYASLSVPQPSILPFVPPSAQGGLPTVQDVETGCSGEQSVCQHGDIEEHRPSARQLPHLMTAAPAGCEPTHAAAHAEALDSSQHLQPWSSNVGAMSTAGHSSAHMFGSELEAASHVPVTATVFCNRPSSSSLGPASITGCQGPYNSSANVQADVSGGTTPNSFDRASATRGTLGKTSSAPIPQGSNGRGDGLQAAHGPEQHQLRSEAGTWRSAQLLKQDARTHGMLPPALVCQTPPSVGCAHMQASSAGMGVVAKVEPRPLPIQHQVFLHNGLDVAGHCSQASSSPQVTMTVDVTAHAAHGPMSPACSPPPLGESSANHPAVMAAAPGTKGCSRLAHTLQRSVAGSASSPGATHYWRTSSAGGGEGGMGGAGGRTGLSLREAMSHISIPEHRVRASSAAGSQRSAAAVPPPSPNRHSNLGMKP